MAAISVNLITKDQPGPTVRALASLENFLKPGDEIVVLDTGSSKKNLKTLKRTLPEFEGVEVRILEEPSLSQPLMPYIEQWLPEQVGKIESDEQYRDLRGILNFAEARQIALEASTRPLVFWLDSDDVLIEKAPGRLREIIDRSMDPEDPQYSALFLEYQYAFLEDGTLCTTLKRERVAVRKWFNWKGRCHETLIPTEDCDRPVGFCEDLGAYICHTDARKGPGISDIRNYVIMRRELDELSDTDYVDPRTLLYLGNAARGLGRWKEAIDLYKKFEGQSGSFEDRFAACMYIASIYMHHDLKRPIDAHDWYQKATEIKPRDPRGYFGMSRCYLARYRYQECLDWFSIGRQFPEPRESAHSYDPNSVHFTPYLIAAEAALELDLPDEAHAFAQQALQFRPNDEDAQKICKRIEQTGAGIALTRSLLHVANHIPGGGPNVKRAFRHLFENLYAVPEQIEKRGFGRTESVDPRPEAPKMAIFCGETPEEWGPLSAKTGIGGSEKMVILLAPVLQKLGWNVTVYGSIPFPQRGVYKDGVRWQHWSELDTTVPVDTLVAWRGHGHLLLPVSANRRILWLHDVQNPAAYTDDVLACLDLAIFQSEYHAAPVRGIIPDEKILVANNAISIPEGFDPVARKDPKKIVFLSSPDRGLATALRMVGLAQQHDPEINVTVLYGFSPYERKSRAFVDHKYIPDLGREAATDDYERFIGQLIDATGARMLNRVSFAQVWEELATAGMWLYPTRFPEISCMSAMEAQAAGCVCLSTRFAALNETLLPEAKQLGIDLGPVENSDEYVALGATAILKGAEVAADDSRRQAQSLAAIKRYDVEVLGSRWKDELVAETSGGVKAGNG